jgi:DNA invertase Pin-like site-specific DNA recombinase
LRASRETSRPITRPTRPKPIRQSSLQQVHDHRESTARQYDLRRRAQALGWTTDQIVVIDEDLGLSGASATARNGFQRLVADV